MITRALADSVRVFATAIPVALIISPNVSDKVARDDARRAHSRPASR
jgi:hypothetical protein